MRRQCAAAEPAAYVQDDRPAGGIRRRGDGKSQQHRQNGQHGQLDLDIRSARRQLDLAAAKHNDDCHHRRSHHFKRTDCYDRVYGCGAADTANTNATTTTTTAADTHRSGRRYMESSVWKFSDLGYFAKLESHSPGTNRQCSR